MHELDRLRGRERADDVAVDPDLGRVVAGAVALAQVEAEPVVGRALAHAAAEKLLEDDADALAALDVAGGAAAPGDGRLGRRRLAKLGVVGYRAVDARLAAAAGAARRPGIAAFGT